MPQNATPAENDRNKFFPDDTPFRRIVIGSTAFGFAAALGSEACLERSPGHGFDFHWHWRALFWMAVGVAGAFRLWKLVWLTQIDADPKANARLARFCVLVGLVALGVFIYPMTFIPDDQIHEVVMGLILAACVLTFVGWMIYRTFQGFVEEDEANPTANNPNQPSDKIPR